MFTHSTITDIKAILDKAKIYGYDDKINNLTGSTTLSSKTITGIDTTYLNIGDIVNGDGIQADSIIASLTTSTITLDKAATKTSSSPINIIANHYGENEFTEAIESVYDDIEFDMQCKISESTYDDIDTTLEADLTLSQKLIIRAERYLIAAKFLEKIYNKEYQSRLSMREFKVVDGMGVSTGGLAGKDKVANDFRFTANQMLTKAGYNRISIQVY